MTINRARSILPTNPVARWCTTRSVDLYTFWWALAPPHPTIAPPPQWCAWPPQCCYLAEPVSAITSTQRGRHPSRWRKRSICTLFKVLFWRRGGKILIRVTNYNPRQTLSTLIKLTRLRSSSFQESHCSYGYSLLFSFIKATNERPIAKGLKSFPVLQT